MLSCWRSCYLMLLVLFHDSRELKSNINMEFKTRGVAAPQPTDDLSPILARTNSASVRIPDRSRSRQQASRSRQLQLTDSSRPQPQSVHDPIAVSSRPVRVPVCGSSLWWSVQQTSKVKGNSKPKNP
ncbi:hypothetical protein F2Q70_00021447 [Brassica cretica]|uniref:Secreted protein n=2 Tax=Brassica cretica TaxID=69181 RepID=A0A8S9HRD9_BRACR|nr:hypothetical protein F2Q70_00021447 [Brassica cretica]KAF2560064.1 hypothetical protein F2Q68_00014999 [Brassica cretica]KAF3604893.1 hypothetical protein DY000_02047742 [Brassica cretica]